MTTRINIEAYKVVREGKEPFWIAHPPKFNCSINLKEVKMLIFPSRSNPDDFTVFFDDPKEERRFDQTPAKSGTNSSDEDDSAGNS